MVELMIGLYFQRGRKAGEGLKKELDTIILQLEDIRKQIIERKNQFA